MHPVGQVDGEVTLSPVFTLQPGHGVLRMGAPRGPEGQTGLKSVVYKKLCPVVVLKVA